MLAEGDGTSFSRVFNATVEGDLLGRFYADANDDGEWSSGEQWLDSEPFEAQYPKVYSLHIDVSSELFVTQYGIEYTVR